MKQVVQSAGGGPVEVVDAPRPQLTTASVLVKTEATLISAGTERAVTQLAQSSLIDKARARPDLVRQVISKAKTDGLKPTIAAVRSRLADDLALGYSGAGTVLEIGSAVRGLRVGDRVATGGGGFASHAEYQAVPWVLASKLPDSVSSEQAAFATVASVGLHGFRQADVSVGAKVVVVGLGLIGQMTARMAVAAGCDVAGIDLSPQAVSLAQKHGVLGMVEQGEATTQAILDWTRGRGADAIVITAGAQGNSSVIQSTPARCRDRAVVVAVGDIGLDLNRNDFYHKEIELRLARSYGPGRYDRTYEDWGVDYPEGYVRWTEGRNLEAVIDLLASERLDVDDLITHRFDISDATRAYEVLEDKQANAIGVVLEYPERAGSDAKTISVRPTGKKPKRTKPSGSKRVGIIGAGLFVKGTIIPGMREAGFGPIVHISSASGVSAARVAEREGIAKASSDALAVINDPEVDVVVVASPHSTHAEFTALALEAGKDVYCEKPLALTFEELERVEQAYEANQGNLYVGFNRRHSAMVKKMVEGLEPGSGPIQVHYRVNAGSLPPSHWYSDRREGGRLLGEVCHFVDTCNALVGDQVVTSVNMVSPNSDQHDSYHLLIGYADGSSASVIYASDANAGTPKEWCEVTGRGHTMALDNYRALTIDGQNVSCDSGKGHAEGMRALAVNGRQTAFSTMHLLLSAIGQSQP